MPFVRQRDGSRDAIGIDSNPLLRIPSKLIASQFPTPRQSRGAMDQESR